MRSTTLHRRAVVLTAAAALAAGAVAATSSSAAPARHSGARSASGTIHVVEHAITDTEQPAGSPDAAGHILTFTNPVYNAANTKQVGRDEGFCTRLDVKRGIWECLWTTFLKGGQITVQGPYYDTRNSVLSITGGTGAYRRSRGQMILRSRNGGKEYDFIFQLG
jgi:allene oxide cyclase